MGKRTIRVVGAAIIIGNKCLVAQRSAEMSLPLKWEFPGGKVRDGETPKEALRREILEELGVTIQVNDLLDSGSSSTPTLEVLLDVYSARLLKGDPHPHEHSAIRWVAEKELDELDWAEADIPVLPRVAALLSRGRSSRLTNP